jgi:plastocyanin
MSRYYLRCQQLCRRSALRNCLRPEILICFLAIGLALLSFMRAEGLEPQQSSAAVASKAEVAIDNFSFSPREITVPIGTTVTWTNHDDVPHVVASSDDQFKKSAAVDTDESFSHTFTAAGNYIYFCSIHPHMTGKIIVKEQSNAAERYEINLLFRPLESGPSGKPASAGVACQRLYGRGAIGRSRAGRHCRSYTEVRRRF